MGLYARLLDIEKNLTPLTNKQKWGERLAVWTLRNVFGRRYWRELAHMQAGMLPQKRAEDMARYRTQYESGLPCPVCLSVVETIPARIEGYDTRKVGVPPMSDPIPMPELTTGRGDDWRARIDRIEAAADALLAQGAKE